MCGSEFAMMLEHYILPHYMRKALGGEWFEKRAAWDEKCKAYCLELGLPISAWPSVHFPFNWSLDNATIHKKAIIAMTAPRVSREVEFQMVDLVCCQLAGLKELFPARLRKCIPKTPENFEPWRRATQLRPNDARIDARVFPDDMSWDYHSYWVGKIQGNLKGQYDFNKDEDCYRCVPVIAPQYGKYSLQSTTRCAMQICCRVLQTNPILQI